MQNSFFLVAYVQFFTLLNYTLDPLEGYHDEQDL